LDRSSNARISSSRASSARPCRSNGIATGQKLLWRIVHAGDFHKGVAKFGRVTLLLAVVAGPHGLGAAFCGIVVDGAAAVLGVLIIEEVGAGAPLSAGPANFRDHAIINLANFFLRGELQRRLADANQGKPTFPAPPAAPAILR
jgi:hypothetical protein